MLIRADPITKSVSLLSFPRDLAVPIYCNPSTPLTTDRINSAYSRCGSSGSLLTIEKLTGLPISYLITVNFHGFKEVVDKLHGVWMDVDRRYYNKNTGRPATTTRTSTSCPATSASTASRHSTSSASATRTPT